MCSCGATVPDLKWAVHAADIDKVAEAIWNSTPGDYPWDGMGPESPTRKTYLDMARAAVGAMGGEQ